MSRGRNSKRMARTRHWHLGDREGVRLGVVDGVHFLWDGHLVRMDDGRCCSRSSGLRGDSLHPFSGAVSFRTAFPMGSHPQWASSCKYCRRGDSFEESFRQLFFF